MDRRRMWILEWMGRGEIIDLGGGFIEALGFLPGRWQSRMVICGISRNVCPPH